MKDYKTKKSIGAISLTDYLDEKEAIPFQWGKHDCVHFVCEYVLRNKSVDIPIPSYTTLIGAVRQSRRVSVIDRFDTYMERVAHIPQEGGVVAKPIKDDATTGYLVGLVVGSKGAFVSESGLVFQKLDPSTDLYWEV